MEESIAELLGRSSKVVGVRQVLRGLMNGTVKCVIVSLDAEEELRLKIETSARAHGVPVRSFPSMKELGEVSGIAVGAAVVGINESEAKN